MGSVPAVIRSRDRVNSGTLHQAVIVREENTGSVQIDGGRRVTGTTRGGDIRMNVRRTPVYLGGAPRHSKYLPPAKLYKTPFKGCIHSMRVDNKKVEQLTIYSKLGFKLWSKKHMDYQFPYNLSLEIFLGDPLMLVAYLAWRLISFTIPSTCSK